MTNSCHPRHCHRHRRPSPLPAAYDEGFSWFSPKKVLLEDTTDSVVVLGLSETTDDGEGSWDGGTVVGGGVGGVVGGIACRPVGGGGGNQ